jgi:very-short-patch-repair endonuclease
MSPLWDIRQSVRTLAEDFKIRYQEMTSEDTVDFMCAAVTVILKECENQ